MDELRQHMRTQHENSTFPCNDCRYKAQNLSQLDDHIGECHSYSRSGRKNIDIRNLNDKMPCDPSNPLHSSTCCDRQPNQQRKRCYSQEERKRNGACYYWNQGYCRHGDLCKYLHIEICRYQEECRRPDSCRFFHILQKNHFLGRRSSQGFMYREEEFPTLDQSSKSQRKGW